MHNTQEKHERHLIREAYGLLLEMGSSRDYSCKHNIGASLGDGLLLEITLANTIVELLLEIKPTELLLEVLRNTRPEKSTLARSDWLAILRTFNDSSPKRR